MSHVVTTPSSKPRKHGWWSDYSNKSEPSDTWPNSEAMPINTVNTQWQRRKKTTAIFISPIWKRGRRGTIHTNPKSVIYIVSY